MKETILEQLYQFERENEIKVLYAVESGSRAWGFASKDSDWDVRYIYIHKPEWYLQIDTGRDNRVEILPSNIDLVGWEVRKAFRLLSKSNPPFLEWLRSPIVYINSGTAGERMRELSYTFFNRKTCLNHYLNIAANSFDQYLTDGEMKIKKFFYVIRPLLACSWIEEKGTLVPVEFEILLENQVSDNELKAEIKSLMKIKSGGDEKDKVIENRVLNEYLSDRLEYYKEFIRTYPAQARPEREPLNMLFRNFLEDFW
jgi:uncharacterized protein